MYLVDTNILIYAAIGKEPVASLFTNWLDENKIVLSVVVISEFLAGTKPEENFRLEVLLEQVLILDVDLPIARVAADYRASFSRKKNTPLLLDCFLAATAKINNLILVTHNTTDFPMQDIKIIDPFDK